MGFEIKKPEPTTGGVVSLRLSPEDYERLHKLAVKNEMSMGSVARQMVEYCLKEIRDDSNGD